MDFRIIFPVFSMLSFGIFHLGAPAALGLGTEPARHSRTKRCSCASFLDKECVYFCHLDIIWVNTPERTVSYGLGNAPRKKRSVTEPVMPFSRCKCAESRDKTCSLFCRTDTTTTKSEATSHGPIHHCAEKKCKQKMQMTRPKNTKRTDVLSRLRAVKNINLLLKKWRERRH